MKCPHCSKHYASNRAVVVEYNGESMSLRELAFAVGLPPSTLIQRYARGKRDAELIKPAASNGRKRIAGSLALVTDRRPVADDFEDLNQQSAAA